MAGPIDKVGPWTEVKLEIIQAYAAAFATITGAHRFARIYIDGFSGPGVHASKETGAEIAGTPLRILKVKPAFAEYHFVDIKPGKVKLLRERIGSHRGVSIYEGDSNKVLLERVLPTMRYESFRKGLMLLDPYGLTIDWKVIEMAGKSGCVDLLLNLPIMDMNMNVLMHDRSSVDPSDRSRMNRFWGSEEWEQAAYHEQGGLFGGSLSIKQKNEPVVEAFCQRLQDVAGFPFVSTPLMMPNEQGAPLYYLIGASPKRVGKKVFDDVFEKQRRKRSRSG